MLFILKSIFIFAEKHKLISNNICQDIEFTKVKIPQLEIYGVNQNLNNTCQYLKILNTLILFFSVGNWIKTWRTTSSYLGLCKF